MTNPTPKTSVTFFDESTGETLFTWPVNTLQESYIRSGAEFQFAVPAARLEVLRWRAVVFSALTLAGVPVPLSGLN